MCILISNASNFLQTYINQGVQFSKVFGLYIFCQWLLNMQNWSTWPFCAHYPSFKVAEKNWWMAVAIFLSIVQVLIIQTYFVIWWYQHVSYSGQECQEDSAQNGHWAKTVTYGQYNTKIPCAIYNTMDEIHLQCVQFWPFRNILDQMRPTVWITLENLDHMEF